MWEAVGGSTGNSLLRQLGGNHTRIREEGGWKGKGIQEGRPMKSCPWVAQRKEGEENTESPEVVLTGGSSGCGKPGLSCSLVVEHLPGM